MTVEKKPLVVIGVGIEGRAGLTPRALQRILSADELWGNDRLLSQFQDLKIAKVSLSENLLQKIESLPLREADKAIVLLASGDPGFYGLGSTLLRKFPEEKIQLIPQPGFLQEAFSAAGIAWEDAALLSAHSGIHADLIHHLRRQRKIGILTSPKNTPANLARLMLDSGLAEGMIYVLENLGMEDQRIFQGSVAECASRTFADLNVMLIVRDETWQAIPEGAIRPDEAYARRNGLITKRDVRLLCLDRLQIRPDDTVWDIGAGSGALSIEAAERARKGKVFSFEKDTECIRLIQTNRERFHVRNLKIIAGEAPESLTDHPLPQRVFVGGSGGYLTEILDFLLARLKKPWNLVMTFAILDNLLIAVNFLRAYGFNPEIVQADFKYTAKIENGLRLVPQNPVFILSLTIGD